MSLSLNDPLEKMGHVNIEIKAKCAHPKKIRAILEEEGARHAGRDHQIDTYFRVENGRLKLREGEIENALIFYRRPDVSGPKRSDVVLLKTEPGSPIKSILTEALGIDVIVDKRRDIYFIGNVKFHVDDVTSLGSFVEIEAIDRDGSLGEEKLLAQCRGYQDLLGIGDETLVSQSYSDLLRGN